MDCSRVGVAPTGSADGISAEADDPIVVVPPCARGSALGAIAIFELVDRRSGPSELDHRLFDLLAQHVSKALVIARLQGPEGNADGPSLRSIERITN